MKNLILLIIFMGVGVLNMQGQDYSYKKSCKGMKKSCHYSNVALAFDTDSDIMIVSDPETGTLKYIRKSICPYSASVWYEDVVFNAYTGVFVSQEPDRSECLGIKKENCSIECLLICSDNSSTGNSQIPKT